MVIGSKDISFSDGLTETSYTITSSLDEVNFNKIITEGDITIEKPGFTNYTIEGVSASQDGEYVTSGSVAGKSGNLEIIGDISDIPFSYTLTNFMQADDTFSCTIPAFSINFPDVLHRKSDVCSRNTIPALFHHKNLDTRPKTW